ncbi:hypothetical protein ACGFIR_11580 [Micromonospora sp. NPDC049051]|uniref:hypothetical protein n=1 Tax=Micromonospora sp. NPDC049051 TaxID=3364264 RepID=UPI0037192FF0
MATTRTRETTRASSRVPLRTVSRRALLASVPAVVAGVSSTDRPALAAPAVECLADLGTV